MADVLVFGEVLWDIIDGVPHLGGAAFNFAAHLAHLGTSSALVSAVGNDALGERALAHARRHGVDVSNVVRHSSLPTGTVRVKLEKGIPSYEIVCPVAWDEIPSPTGIAAPRAIYFGTLAQRKEISRATLARLLAARRHDALVFFDVNLRQRFWSAEVLRQGLAAATVVKLSDEETAPVSQALWSGSRAEDEVSARLLAEFPNLQGVLVTRGARGCRVAERGREAFSSPAVPDGPVVDTVGAGDAFSAAFVQAVLSGGDFAAAARAGNVLGGKVVARAGAVPE